MEFKRRITSKDLGLIAKSKEFTDDEISDISKNIMNIRRQVGLDHAYKNFVPEIFFEAPPDFPDFIIYGFINWTGGQDKDYTDAQKFGEELLDATKKIKKILDTVKKKYPDIKIVKYPKAK